MTIIKHLIGRTILDSRGTPTVEAELVLENGIRVFAAAPSGASTGMREAVEKRDGESAYHGKGTTQAAQHISNEIAAALVGKDVVQQETIDDILIKLDGSDNKARLGANAILSVSLAASKAAAASAQTAWHAYLNPNNTRLPTPLMNVLNGGAHAANNLDIQEFMIVPHGFSSFPEALQAGVEVFYTLKNNLHKSGLSTAVGDEGGFAPDLQNNEHALDLLTAAITDAGYACGEQISIALDCAASEFYKEGQYNLPANNFCGDANALIDLFADWVARYPIISIEDACDENDWDGWQALTQRLGSKVQLVGDDLFVTNPAILKQGIDRNIANALLVKPNQIGTLSETRAAVQLAGAAGYATIMSHRSGETEYSDIADLAVGMGCEQIKTGAPCRSERTAKYNQLLRIAESLTTFNKMMI